MQIYRQSNPFFLFMPVYLFALENMGKVHNNKLNNKVKTH